MTTTELSEKLMFNVNRALSSGTPTTEVIAVLECIKIALAQTVIKTNRQSAIAPVTMGGSLAGYDIGG